MKFCTSSLFLFSILLRFCLSFYQKCSFRRRNWHAELWRQRGKIQILSRLLTPIRVSRSPSWTQIVGIVSIHKKNVITSFQSMKGRVVDRSRDFFCWVLLFDNRFLTAVGGFFCVAGTGRAHFCKSWPIPPQTLQLYCWREWSTMGSGALVEDDMMMEKMKFEVGWMTWNGRAIRCCKLTALCKLKTALLSFVSTVFHRNFYDFLHQHIKYNISKKGFLKLVFGEVT